MKLGNTSTVQFLEAARLKAVKWCTTYADGRVKEVFIDGVPLTVRGGPRLFLGRELETHLTQLAKYVGTPLKPQHGQVDESQIAPRRFWDKERSHSGVVVANVDGTGESTIGNQSRSRENELCVLTKEYGTTSNRMIEHCRLCLEKVIVLRAFYYAQVKFSLSA